MLTASVSAPQPPPPLINTEPVGVLRKILATRGKCAPTALAARPVFKVGEDHDPWFPIEESGDPAVERARAACKGCPVIADCRIVARHDEMRLGAVHGVLGGLSADERRAEYTAIREATTTTASDSGVAA